MFVVCGKRFSVEVVCDQTPSMSEEEGSSSEVRVFITEQEALWYEFEHGFSQQGSSSEGNPFADVPSGRAVSQTGAKPSGRVTDEVDSNDAEVVESEETPVIAMTVAIEAEFDAESHHGEGMLIKNPKSSVMTDDVRL